MHELRGCRNERLDRLQLAGPLAIVDPTPLRGTPEPTWRVSADLIHAQPAPPAGRSSCRSKWCRIACASRALTGPTGSVAPIHLVSTGHAAWQRLAVGSADHLLAVSWVDHGDARGASTYRRYSVGAQGWRWTAAPGAPRLWESDADFPGFRVNFP